MNRDQAIHRAMRILKQERDKLRYRKSREEELLARIMLAQNNGPDLPELFGVPVVNASDEGAIAAMHRRMNDNNPNNIPEYIGEGTVLCDGNLSHNEGVRLLTQDNLLVKPNGYGLSFTDIGTGPGSIIQYRVNLIAAVYGGDASNLVERSGISYSQSKQGVMTLNRGLYGSNKDRVPTQPLWHYTFQTTFPNLKSQLRDGNIFLGVFGQYAARDRRNFNKELSEDEQNYISWDPRVVTTRVSTTTGKVRERKSLLREA